MKKAFITIFLSGMFVSGHLIQAQNAIPASGANGSGAGGTISYTVGQVVYTTSTGTMGSVAQGVQQPYEISVVTSLEEAKDFSLEFVVYPNPATDYIMLKIKNYEVQNLRYQLFNISGTILQDNKVESDETRIIMSNLFPATYFLKVTDKNKVLKIFKIIKN